MSPSKEAVEIFDVVDRHDQVVGQAPRDEVHARGWRHRAVHILIFNRRGEIFLQQRAPTKDRYPDRWDSSAAGHLDTGEDYRPAAIRELEEELGLRDVPLTDLFALPACPETGEEFVRVYRAEAEGPFALAPEEITTGAWFAWERVSAWVRERPDDFAPAFVLLWRHLVARGLPAGTEAGDPAVPEELWTEGDPLALVRTSCALLTAQTDQVHLDDEALDRLAEALLPLAATPPTWDPETHYTGPVAATVSYVLALDAINFGSGWFPHLRKRAGRSGYYTIAMGLRDHYATHGPLTIAQLRAADASFCATLCGQAGNAAIAELMGLFARAWNDLGALLEGTYGGDPVAFVEAAGGSAAQLVRQLLAMPLYRDFARVGHLGVALLKRAQITINDLALALPDDPRGRFYDRDQLTLFADNLIPHLLRHEGVLHYRPEVAARIDEGGLLAPGEVAEVAARAAAVTAVERLTTRLRAAGRKQLTAADVDVLLWLRGQQPTLKARPRPRCRTPFY